MEWILCIVGFFVGAIVAYLIAERRCRERIGSLQTNVALAEQRATELSNRLGEQRELLNETETKFREAFASLSADALAKNSASNRTACFANSSARSRKLSERSTCKPINSSPPFVVRRRAGNGAKSP